MFKDSSAYLVQKVLWPKPLVAIRSAVAMTVVKKGKKVKERIALYGEIRDRATERHLPYGITQF